MRLLVISLLLLFWSVANAQIAQMNQLRPGKIGISIYMDDTLINVGSTKLKVVINDQTKGIIIRLDPSTLRTGIDSLDVKLKALKWDEVVFEGEIDLDKLWQIDDVDQSFEVEGDLTVNDESQQVSMYGSLRESQQGMDVNGLLYLHFDPLLIDFGLDEVLPQFAEHACVEILQPVSIADDRH
ncbi:MAG: hypothetical protein RL266_848 [Bacteroidota bacterium]|jgi:hypothetical protein